MWYLEQQHLPHDAMLRRQ